MQSSLQQIYDQYKLPEHVSSEFWLGWLVFLFGFIPTVMLTIDFYQDPLPVIVLICLGIVCLVFVCIVRAVFLGAASERDLRPYWLNAVFVGDAMLIASVIPSIFINSTHNVVMEGIYTVLFSIAIIAFIYVMFSASGAPTGKFFSFCSALAALLVVTALWTDSHFVFVDPRFIAGFSFLLMWRGCYIIKESRWIDPEVSTFYLKDL